MRATLLLVFACSGTPASQPAPVATRPASQPAAPAVERTPSGRVVAFCDQRLDTGATASINCNDLQLGCPSIDLAMFADFDLEGLTLPAICASDLRPLAKHARLRRLQLRVASGTDLAPLADLALEELQLVTMVESGSDTLDLAPLAKLRTLRTAEIQVSKLRGTAAIAQWTQLVYLSLRGSGLDEPLPSLAPLRELASMDLLGTRGISRLDGLGAKVKDVGLRKSADFRDLAGFEAAVSLESLDVGLTGVVDLRPLARLAKLRSLALAGTKVADLRPLAQLALEDLDITETLVADAGPIAAMRSLRSLSIGYCPTLASIEPIAKMTWLRELRVPGDTVDCAEHRRLKTALRSTKVEPAGFTHCP